VHLDIKPDNILHSFSGKFKIGDLGLARITTNLEEINEGDSRYLAKEILENITENAENIPDLTKADMFSLGATLYEIVTHTDLPSRGQ